jgi:RNA polymerase sigma-70 factor (ECF subfamily)
MMNQEFLLQQIKSGNEKAFKELVQDFGPRVFNLCYRFLLNNHDAEDVAQEVFIEIHKSVRNFKGEAKLSTWIFRIATTKCLDELKKRKRKKRIVSFGKVIGLDKIANWLSGSESPETIIEQDESVRLLLQALDALPENQRIALTLSKLQDYSSTEIAEVLNISLTAVDSLIYRGKQNLKSTLENKERQNRS